METLRITVEKTSGGSLVFSGRADPNVLWQFKDRKRVDIHQDTECEELVVTEDEVDRSFLGGESHREKMTRIPMVEVARFTIEDHGSRQFTSDIYEKRTYVDQMGIPRMRFVRVGGRRSE